MFVPCLGFEVGNLLLTMRVSGNNGGWVVAPWTTVWVEAADNAIGGCTTVTASLRLQSRDHSGNQRRRPLCCLCQLWWEILRLPGSLWASGVGRLSLFPLIVASRKKQCFPLAQRAWWKYCDTIGHGAILPFSRFLNLCLKNLILSSKHTKRQCVVFQLCLHRRRSRQPMLSLSLSLLSNAVISVWQHTYGRGGGLVMAIFDLLRIKLSSHTSGFLRPHYLCGNMPPMTAGHFFYVTKIPHKVS